MNEKLSVVVSRIDRECEGVLSFELVSDEGHDLPPFRAGAHIDVYLESGQVRQYSLCSDPLDRSRYRIGVLLDSESRGGSRAMHQLTEGVRCEIGYPRNNFPLVEDAEHSLFVAGGIGVTPILAMAYRLSGLGKTFDMHYCCRTRSHAPFLLELHEASFSEKVHFHFDDEGKDQHFDPRIFADYGSGSHLYVCGPPGFISYVLDSARKMGWASSQLHREYFASQAETKSDEQFDVILERTGIRVTVPPGKSIVDVLHDHGVEVPVSCQQGVCGTCVTRVIQGIPDHRDMILTEEEHSSNAVMTPCCSRAKSQVLVLDI